MLTLRIRSVMWFAVGIAMSIILVWSFAAWRASAAPGANESTFVPVTPTRILDTRDPTNVGLAGPFVSAVPQDLQITGSIATTTGSQLVVPAGARGVVLNTTVINSTANGFLSIRNADAAGPPTTSSLNFLAGEVLANAVEVPLPTAGADAGKIEITYDAYGTLGPRTDVIVDIVGYFTSQGLQELVADVAAIQAQMVSTKGRAVFSGGQQFVGLTAAPFVARTLTFTPPSNGTIIVTSNAGGVAEVEEAVTCSITQGLVVDANFNQIFEGSTAFDRGMLSGVRGYDVVGGVPFTVRLVCVGDGVPSLFDSNLSATFTSSTTPGSMSVTDAGDAGSPEIGAG